MDILLLLCAAFAGTIAGSFLNALLFRYNTGKSMGGRSRCMHCGHTLRALDLIPIFSYLALRGKCRYCRSNISLQYPMVELAASLISVALAYTLHNPLSFGLAFVVWMTYLFLFVYDMRHRILPLEALLVCAMVTLALLFLSCDGVCTLVFPSLWSLVAGPVVAFPLFFISAVSQGRWMGWGDGFLALSFGWLVGISKGFTAIAIACWIGSIVGLLFIAYASYVKKSPTRKFSWFSSVTMSSEIPFGPFLVIGTLVSYFFHVDLFQTLLLL